MRGKILAEKNVFRNQVSNHPSPGRESDALQIHIELPDQAHFKCVPVNGGKIKDRLIHLAEKSVN